MKNMFEKFKPLKGHVLIKREDAPTEKGGIIIPEAYQIRGCRASVVKTGDDVEDIKSGDEILYQREYTVLPFKEREMAITEGKTILAKVEIDGNVERIMPFGSYVMIRMDRPSDYKDGIALSDNTKDKIIWGTVCRIGKNCVAVKPEQRVLFETGKGIVCVENDAFCRLVKEDEILCIKNM